MAKRATQFVKVGLLLMMQISPPVHASEAALLKLLEVLHADGTLSDEKYMIVKLIKPAQETESSSPQTRSKLPEQPGGDAIMISRGKLEMSPSERDSKVRIGGRIMADGAIYDDDTEPLGSGVEMRRARLFMQGTLWQVWNYKLQYDFTGSGKAGINDAYLQYIGLPAGQITLGHFKEPFSLQNMTSSKYVSFIERGLPHLFTPGRSLGIAYGLSGKHWRAKAGIFAQGIDTPGDELDQSYAITGRMTYAPVYEKDWQVLHLGLSLSYRQLDENRTLRFRERPESHITNLRLVDTGDIDADSLYRYNVELFWSHGPFAIQGEYTRAAVDRAIANQPDPVFAGYYVEGSWFLTGESLHYKPAKGTLGKITPKRILGRDGWGAWQIALRFSSLDLTDQDVLGGREQNLTLGLNWYTHPNLRFMANYIKVLDVEGGPHAGDEPAAVALRAQIEF